MDVIIAVIGALVLVDSLNRWLHPEDYEVQMQRRDWLGHGREW